MKKKMLLGRKGHCLIGLIVGLLFLGIAQNGTASIIYSEEPTNTSGTGWSNTEITDASDYGIVHGLWGYLNNQLSNSFALSGDQTEVTIDFRYWAISTWDTGETAQLLVNNSSEWSSTVASWNGVTSPWTLYSGVQFPGNNHGRNLTRYQDISVSIAFSGTSLDVDFRGNLNQVETDESWAVSDINISDNSNAPVPEPATMLLFGVGLIGLAGVSRRKK